MADDFERKFPGSWLVADRSRFFLRRACSTVSLRATLIAWFAVIEDDRNLLAHGSGNYVAILHQLHADHPMRGVKDPPTQY